jgi:oligopeptide transport system substrate-binding protein
VRLVKNERYHAADSVRLGVVDALAVDSATTALALYETAQVDWSTALPPFAVRELAARAAPDLRRSPELTIGFYRLNTTRPPLDDARVRRALALSIDRERIVAAVFGPGERPSRSFVPPGIETATGYEPVECEGENVPEARRLMTEAGFVGGRGFPKITISFNADEGHQMVAELVQSQWKERLGIDVGLEAMEWGSFLDAQGRLDYWVGRAGWGADYVDPNTFLDLFTSTNANNQTGFSSSRYDDLIARAAKATDRDARNEIFHEAESLLLRELPVIPLYVRSSRNLVAPWVKGFVGNPLDWHPIESLDVDRPARDAARSRRGHAQRRR